MASTTTANNSFQITDEIYDKAKTLYEAAVHEGGGSILKDYYTIFEYRDRRAKFFDKLPNRSRRPGAIHEMVRRDAEIIFDEHDGKQQLDALDVRERELDQQFEILLPLPTTANTQTIDNFKTCPPIDGSRVADEESEDEDDATEDGDYEVNEAEEDCDEDVEDGRDVPTPGGSATHSTPVTSPAVGTNSDFQKKIALLNDPVSIANFSDLATPMLPGLMRPKPGKALLQQPNSTPPVDSVYTQKTTTSPKNFSVAPGVSSMARYGMPGPIKSQHRQHTPEKAVMIAPKPTSASKINPNTIVTSGQTDAVEPVAKKQKLDHIAAKSAKAPAIPKTSHTATTNNQAPAIPSGISNQTTSQPLTTNRQAPAASSDATKSTTLQQTTNDQQSTIKSSGIPTSTTSHSTTNNLHQASVPSGATATAAAPTAAQRRLNDIITGRMLPRSKQEAKDAADEQHTRLLTAYRNQNQNQSSTTRKSARQSTINTNPDPDFMPHYFSAANFSPVNPNVDPEDDENGSVRCICGIIENDGEGMFQCLECQVWQHTGCIFPGLNEAQVAEEEKKDFWCTVCDPYAHRYVLKDLRAGQSVGSKQNGKGQGKAKAKGKAKGKSKK